MTIGLQLYTLRDYTRNMDDLKDSLAKLAKCGYTVVETAGYYGLSAGELAELLAYYGLRTVSTHTGFEAVVSNLQQVIADHKALGATHCSVPSMPGRWYCRTRNGFAAFAERMEIAAEELAKEGITLSYHNHGFEFLPVEGDTCGEAVLLDHAPSVHLQLDTGHCYAAHEDPADWLARYENRIVTVHYKDVQFVDGVRRDVAIGEGEVDWAAVTAAVKKSDCEYIIVEHEEFNRDPWDILKTSYENIRSYLK